MSEYYDGLIRKYADNFKSLGCDEQEIDAQLIKSSIMAGVGDAMQNILNRRGSVERSAVLFGSIMGCVNVILSASSDDHGSVQESAALSIFDVIGTELRDSFEDEASVEPIASIHVEGGRA